MTQADEHSDCRHRGRVRGQVVAEPEGAPQRAEQQAGDDQTEQRRRATRGPPAPEPPTRDLSDPRQDQAQWFR